MRMSLAFDLDGTLIDISLRDYNVYKDILSEFGYNYLAFENYWPLRKERTNIYDILSFSGLNKEECDNFIGKRNQLIEHDKYLKYDKVLGSTINILNLLKNKYDLYIVTKRQNQEDTFSQIKYLGLESFFKDILVSSNSKVSEYGKINDLELIVGDTENDLLAAMKLNVRFIGVTTGIRSKKKLSELGADVIVDDLNQLLNLL